MRQKSATQFGGVPRLSRLVALEAMVLSYYVFLWSYKLTGNMLEDGLFLEILRAKPKPADLTSTLVVQSLIHHIPYHLFPSCHLLYSLYQYQYRPIVWEDICFNPFVLLPSFLSFVLMPPNRFFPQAGVFSSNQSTKKHSGDSTGT